MSRRVRQLTQDAEKLKEARTAAKAAQEALRSSENDAPPTSTPSSRSQNIAQSSASVDDEDQAAKINALYGTLPTIEKLAPLLPPVLDRLRSLRTIHADAAGASEALKEVERQQQEMAAEIRKWREGLDKVEAVMKASEGRIGGNMKVVEGWVKELEARMAKLDP
jgi:nuclear migration protein JNM1